MQEFAPNNTMPSGHPTAEELAAYIDGNLGRKEADRVTEHLASCEDCYDVYSGSVRFLLATEPAPQEANVVRFPPRKLSQRPRRMDFSGGRAASWGSAVAAAAALLVLSGGLGGYLLLSTPPALRPDKVAGPVLGKPLADGSLWVGPTYRGGGDEGEEAPFDPASFQMGVQLVNLQVKLAANDGPGAQDIVARILQTLEGQFLTEGLKTGYRGITTAIANGTPPRDLIPKASQLAQQARELLDAQHLDFGQWVEAGRLAAIAKEPSFFQDGDSRAFLRRLRWRQKFGIGDLKIDPQARQSLEEISEVLGKGDLAGADYASLQQSFDRILEVYYPQT
jgi:hypothetical protein